MFSYEIKKMETNHEIDGKGYAQYEQFIREWIVKYTTEK